MFALRMKMFLMLSLLFAVLYAFAVMVGVSMGMASFNFYLGFSVFLMFIQYMIGPKMVEWSMKVKYVTKEEYPQLYNIIEDQASKANLPMPRVCVSPVQVPNAFAFGRSKHDGRVCVTEGITRLLNEEELKAVIGHEVSHIKNRDVLTITLLSIIPIIMYRIAWHFLFWGGGRRDRGNTALLGLAAFLFYFLTNLLVLYASRIREYFADKGSIGLGNRPEALATALYKLVYGSARMPKEALKEAEGLKAFFLNDPSRAMNEIRELSQIDVDHSGTIDPDELALVRSKTIKLTFGDKLMESMSTHPNMLKRIKHLSTL